MAKPLVKTQKNLHDVGVKNGLFLSIFTLETQIKSNIFDFWPKINGLNQSMHFLRELGASLGKIFTPTGCFVCLSTVLPLGWGGGSNPS